MGHPESGTSLDVSSRGGGATRPTASAPALRHAQVKKNGAPPAMPCGGSATGLVDPAASPRGTSTASSLCSGRFDSSAHPAAARLFSPFIGTGDHSDIRRDVPTARERARLLGHAARRSCGGGCGPPLPRLCATSGAWNRASSSGGAAIHARLGRGLVDYVTFTWHGVTGSRGSLLSAARSRQRISSTTVRALGR